MGYIHWINTDGTERIEEAKFEPDWDEMRDFVGGYIEHVNVLYKGKQTAMYVHEEGRIIDLPINPVATDIYMANTRAREAAGKGAFKWPEGVKVISLDPRPDLPPSIHGPAVVMENL